MTSDQAKIEWWPCAMMDEWMPSGEPSPSHWIREAKDGGWHIAAQGDGAQDFECIAFVARLGEVVNFYSVQSYGVIRVVYLGTDGFVTIEPVPTGTNHFNLAFDYECSGGTLAECMEAIHVLGTTDVGDEVEIACQTVTDGVPYRLQMIDRKPAFVPLPAEGRA